MALFLFSVGGGGGAGIFGHVEGDVPHCIFDSFFGKLPMLQNESIKADVPSSGAVALRFLNI